MPELGALATALAALLVVFAWSLIYSRAVAAAKPRLPGLFGPLFDALAAADSAIYNALRKWADPALQPLTALFTRLASTADSLIVGPLAFARAVYAATWRLFSVEIPFAITTAATNARILFDDATAQAQSLYDHLGARLESLAGEVRAALNALRADLGAVEGWALAQLRGLEAGIESNAARLESELAGAVSTELQRAQAAERAIAEGVDAQARQIVAEVSAAEDALAGFVSAQLVDLAGEVRSGLDLERQFALGLAAGLQGDLSGLENSPPWLMVEQLWAARDTLLGAATGELLGAAEQEVRTQIGLAETLTARLRPLVQAAAKAVESRS